MGRGRAWQGWRGGGSPHGAARLHRTHPARYGQERAHRGHVGRQVALAAARQPVAEHAAHDGRERAASRHDGGIEHRELAHVRREVGAVKGGDPCANGEATEETRRRRRQN